MACGDVLSLEDLQTAKKHQLFEAEVITGKAGGVAGGANIDYATNQVTGQTQKTLPAVLRDAGFRPASFTFVTGGTLAVGDSDVAVLWPVSGGGDGQYYIWKGAYPKVIPAASSPAGTGGVSSSGWLPLGDITLRPQLAAGTSVGTGAALVGTASGLNLADYLLKGAGIDPDMFLGPLTDAARMQAAIDLWATDKTRFISLHRSYNITGSTLRVANVETEIPESQLVIVGGELKKLDTGFMFDKPVSGQSQSTGGIKFLATRFFGPKVAGTYILNGHHDFLGTNDSTHILRVSFVACMGYGIQVVFAKPDGYIQSISLDANCVWRQWAGYMIDCGFLFDVDITNPRFESGDAVLKTRQKIGDPAVNSLKIRGGVIEGNSGVSGRQISVGTCYSTVIDGVYQEHNAGGDYEFDQQTGTFHKGLTIIGCGFQPTATQLANPNYYPIELGQGAENAFMLAGNSSSGNLYNASTGNQAPVLDSSSWVAGGFKKFGPLVRRKFEMKGEEFHAQVYDGAGGGLNYTTGLFFTDNVGGSRNYIGWGDQSPSSGGFTGVSFSRGSVVYNKNAGVVSRLYGGVNRNALIMGWQCVTGGTPGVWQEIAVLLPYA
jgi:Tail spike TSP1/Gp66 receptor binding N-terminal domain